MRDTLRLLKYSWKDLLLFEFVYRVFTVLAFIPACKWLFNRALSASRLYYLTSTNLMTALTKPLIVLAALVIVVAAAMCMLLEICCLITCANEGRSGRTLGIVQLIVEGCKQCWRIARPRNLLMLIFTVALIPLSNFMFRSSLIESVPIPEYYAEAFLYPVPNIFFVILGMLLLFVFIGCIMYMYHFFLLEDMSSLQAAKASWSLTRGHRIRGLISFVLWELLVMLAFALVAELVDLLAMSAIYIFTSGNTQTALLYAVINTITSVIKALTSCLTVISCYAYLTCAFADARAAEGKEVPNSAIPKHKDARRLNRMILYPLAAVLLIFIVGSDVLLRPLLIKLNMAEYMPAATTLVIGHRGNTEGTPENTLPAFQKAIDIGADYVELDVQETKDGVIVVTHDSNFKRTAGINRNIWDMTYAEVRQLDVGRKTSVAFRGTHVPTLQEAMDLCRDRIGMIIELKDNGHGERLTEATLELIDKNDFAGQCVIHSCNYSFLQQVKETHPDLRCGYVMSVALGSFVNLPAADFFTVEKTYVDSAAIQRAHAVGKQIYAWTVEDTDEMLQLINLGVDGLIGGNPELTVRTLLEHQSDMTALLHLFGISQPIPDAQSAEVEATRAPERA